MRKTPRAVRRPPRATTLAACLALACASLTLSSPRVAAANELTTAEVGRRIAGVYALAEWQQESTVLRPPAVDGRFIVLDGTITTILRDRSHADGERTDVYLGRYALEGLQFAYGYDDVSQFTEARPGTTASHQPLWTGMRSFAATRADGALRLTSASGQQQFIFTDDGVTYLENGKPLRRWRRVAPR